MKKKKQKSNAKWRKEAVGIAKLIAKHQGGYKCVSCPKTAEQGWQIHGSHILPEGKFLRMSCVPENIMCQCAQCHMLWHEHPMGHEWFDIKFPNRFKNLMEMERNFQKEFIKPDYQKITEDLKEEYQALINQ